MSLININNSKDITGVIKSLAVRHPDVALFYADADSDYEHFCYLVMTYAPGHSKNIDCTEAANALHALFRGEPTLYSVQSVLNSPVWERLGFIVSVEFQPSWSDNWQGTLNVRTTWQEGK